MTPTGGCIPGGDVSRDRDGDGTAQRPGVDGALPLYLGLVDAWLPEHVCADDELRRRGRLVAGLTLILLLLGIETVVFFYWALPPRAANLVALSLTAGMALTLVVPVALRRGRIALASNVLLASSYQVIVTVFVLLGGMQAPLLHWCALMPLLSLLMGTRRSAWIWAGIAGLTIALFSVLGASGIRLENHLALTGTAQYFQRLVDVGSWIAILFAVGIVYERHKDERTAALGAKNEELEREVAQRKQAEERTRYLAYYDDLTKLPNREFFKEQLRQAIERSGQTGRMVGLLFLDLDGFKEVNDTHGHGFGDRLLQQVAHRLAGCIRAADALSRGRDDAAGGVVSRLGGDEFTVVLADIRSPDEASIVARRILKALELPITLEDAGIYISASIGIAIHPTDAVDVDRLLRNADLAMYSAKGRGKNNFQFYAESLNTHAQRRQTLVSDLCRALERDEFFLCYQPIFATPTRSLVGVEALVRWRHPRRGVLAPGAFIELAEESGLIVPLGRWVLEEALRQERGWREAGAPPLRVSINVSSVQLRERRLAASLAAAIEANATPPKQVEIEITENAMMDDEEEASRALGELKGLGVQVALDDFGTGYSSLSYVKRFPVDVVKIDRSFVGGLADDPEARAIATAIIAMAHQLHLRVVAEGVESEAQERFLASHGCDELQGFRLGRPVGPGEIEALAARRLDPGGVDE
jgi:diguanylate cyclase (GGDEF)-like protein